MLLSYVGTKYCGWQKQFGSAALGADSIGATIEARVEQITGEKTSVVGSGRTDSGVHALGQVAHFKLWKRDWEPAVLMNALNATLPLDIRVLKVQRVPIDFHAQHHAGKKQYSYYFQQGTSPIPHLVPFSWWIRKTLNLEAMREAAAHLVGEHDFKGFQAAGANPGPTVRKIFEAEVAREEIQFPAMTPLSQNSPSLVRIRLVGSGFLRQMVRSISGTLLEVGENRRKPESVREILEKKERDLVGQTAPGRALWLERVWYKDLEW